MLSVRLRDVDALRQRIVRDALRWFRLLRLAENVFTASSRRRRAGDEL
jgi:hypothetical protein